MTFSYTTSTQSVTWNSYTYTIDMKAVVFKYNVYTENFSTHLKGLIDITGTPRVY